MSLADLDEGPWHVFALSAATVYVPAASEAEAREVMARNAYKDCPVDTYPLTGTRWTSRDALAIELLRKANGR